MSVVDERGRLFSKINVIDLLVILLLLGLTPVFYFGYKILTKKPTVEVLEKEFIEIETDCRIIKVKPELLNLISVGDKELDENGQIVGEIISLGKSDPYIYEFEIGKDQKITKKHPILKQIDARLKLKAEVNQNKPYYKDREVRIGFPLEFETKKYTLLIVPLEEEKEEEVVERVIDLNVTLKDLDDDTLEKISVGDKELDENGNTIAEILSLGKMESSSTPFDLGGGNLVLGKDSNKKQIFTRMRLKCQVKAGDQLYFKSKKIEHRTPLEFKTNKYEITGLFSDTYKEEEGAVERVIDLNVTLKDLDDNTLEKISVGDKELDENGNALAEILSLGKIESSSTPFDLGGGNLVLGKDSNKKQIFTRMRLKCQVKAGDQLYFKSKKIEHRTPLEFKTNKYEIIGLPSETYQDYLKKKWISLQVKFSRLVPEIAKVVQEGDTEKDALGQTIARIISIISNEPSLVTEIFEGEFISLRHPFNRDIVTSLDVLCVEKEGAYYFKDYQAKMGNEIVFNTTLYSISGMIVGLKMK